MNGPYDQDEHRFTLHRFFNDRQELALLAWECSCGERSIGSMGATLIELAGHLDQVGQDEVIWEATK